MGRSAFARLAMLAPGLALAVAACADLGLDLPASTGPRPPAEIRSGAAEMALQAVERDIPAEEIARSVQRLVEEAQICMAWPALWLEDTGRRAQFLVRYDLMARDWGSEISAESAARMQEYVDLGFLTPQARPGIGPGVALYTLSSTGQTAMQGSPYGGARPSFCGPSGRRVQEITNVEWGEFDCGNLRVSFTHIADDWPVWARTESARARIAQTWSPPGQSLAGRVTLSRQWYRRGSLPSGNFQNGSLRSVCFDPVRTRFAGSDLDLNVGAAAPAAAPLGFDADTAPRDPQANNGSAN